MTLDQQKSILTIALLAAFADGNKDDAEREEIRRIAESLAGDGGVADLPRIYQDVLLQRTSVQAATTSALKPRSTGTGAIFDQSSGDWIG